MKMQFFWKRLKWLFDIMNKISFGKQIVIARLNSLFSLVFPEWERLVTVWCSNLDTVKVPAIQWLSVSPFITILRLYLMILLSILWLFLSDFSCRIHDVCKYSQISISFYFFFIIEYLTYVNNGLLTFQQNFYVLIK